MGSDDGVCEWRTVPLSELTASPATYGVVQPGPATAAGVPMLRVNNFSGHVLDLSEVLHISFEVEAKYERTRIRGSDVLLTVVGSVGQVAIVPDRLNGWNIARAVALIRPKHPELSRWISFVLRSPAAQQQLGAAANTTVQTTINLKDLRALPIPMPSCETREAICVLLGALDDRIESLRSINASLEAIAQALFKSWFVDFDPVRAKAEGREPEGMDAATAALFPSDFDYTREGFLPSGWQPTRYGDVALLSKGTVKPQEAPSTEFQHYSLPAFDAHRLPMVELGETIKSGKTPVPSGAILVSKLNPHIPRIWFVGDVADNSVCSTEFLVWMPRTNAGSAFLYCLAASQVFNSAMRQLVTGTSNSHQRVKPDQLANVEVIAASDEAISAFETIASPLLEKVHHNRQRAATLAALRDTLLPRLISGRLCLPGAEREAEAATA